MDPLPPTSSYYNDLRRCGDDPDYMTANNGSETRRIAYRRAHFGARLPSVRTTYTLSLAAIDREVCSPLSMDLSPRYCPDRDPCTASCREECSDTCLNVIEDSACYPLVPVLAEDLPVALLSQRLYCPFFDKAASMATAGAQLGIVMSIKQADDLYAMAVSSLRASEARALPIPMVLLSQFDSRWLLDRLSGNLTLVVDASEARCEGEAVIAGSSGTLSSNPAGRRYCAGQQCAWHIFAEENAGAFVVLTFTRFELECAQDVAGRPQDFVRVYDGGTRSAPVLATYSCYSAPPLVSSGRELLIEFFSDDVGREDTNYGGFSAEWVAGDAYCASLSSCGACAAGPCSWCATSSSCLATSDALALAPFCAPANLITSADDCCAPGFVGKECAECAPGHFGSGCEPCTCDGGGCNDGAAGDGACDCGGGNCTCGLRSVLVESLGEGPDCADGWYDPLCQAAVDARLFTWDSDAGASFPAHIAATAGMDVLWARVSAEMPAGSAASVSLFYGLVGREYELDSASAYTTRRLPLKHGANVATLRVRLPGRASACEVPVVIERPSSNDTSFAKWLTTSYREQYDTLDRPLVGVVAADSPTLVLASTCAPQYASCSRLFTSSLNSILIFNIVAGGAAVDAGCGRAAHACFNSTMLDLEAPGALIVQGSPSGPKGDMSVALRFPPGETPVELTVRAETGGVARHLVSVRRTLSPINMLLRLAPTGGSLLGTFTSDASSYTIVMQANSRGALDRLQPVDPNSIDTSAQVSAWRLIIDATTQWESICAGMPLAYCLPDPPPAQIGNASSPATLWIVAPETRLPIVLRAEDGGRRQAELVIKCVQCGYKGSTDGPRDPVARMDITASLWLILLLFSAVLLFVTLATLFCIRLQCLRQNMRRRIAEQAEAATFAGATPAEILQVFAPKLIAVDKSAACLDDACSICLGELCEEVDHEEASSAHMAAAPPVGSDAAASREASAARDDPTRATPVDSAVARPGRRDHSSWAQSRPRLRRLRVRPPARQAGQPRVPEGAVQVVDQGPKLVSLPCKHSFHGECIRNWIVHKGFVASCPLCKRLISPEHAATVATYRPSRPGRQISHSQPSASAEAAAAAPIASSDEDDVSISAAYGHSRPAPPRLQFSASQFRYSGTRELSTAAPAIGDGTDSAVEMEDITLAVRADPAGAPQPAPPPAAVESVFV